MLPTTMIVARVARSRLRSDGSRLKGFLPGARWWNEGADGKRW